MGMPIKTETVCYECQVCGTTYPMVRCCVCGDIIENYPPPHCLCDKENIPKFIPPLRICSEQCLNKHQEKFLLHP